MRLSTSGFISSKGYNSHQRRTVAIRAREPATFDHLLQLFISRLPLIKSDEELNAAAQATTDTQNAKHAFFQTIEPVFNGPEVRQTRSPVP